MQNTVSYTDVRIFGTPSPEFFNKVASSISGAVHFARLVKE